MSDGVIAVERCCVCSAWVDGHDVHMFDAPVGDRDVYCRDCAGRHLLVCRECSVRYADAGGVCSRCAARESVEEDVEHACCGV